MRDKVRQYLIEVAREEKTRVTYGELIKDNSLPIKLGTHEGQRQLKVLLSEISTFENDSGRPMLTALAINKTEDDPGYGFYELAENFGHGNQKDLKKKGWANSEASRVREFWSIEKHYEDFKNLSISFNRGAKLREAFETLVLQNTHDRVSNWATEYLAFVKDVKIVQDLLRRNSKLSIDDPTLFQKVSKPIRSYTAFMQKWLRELANGISSRGQSVLSDHDFKLIINDSVFKALARQIFVNPGEDSHAQLSNWWLSNDKISNRPLLINRAVAACSPETLSSTVDTRRFWVAVDVLQKRFSFNVQIQSWNWVSVNQLVTSWLDRELASEIQRVSNDRLTQLIWRNIFVWLIYNGYHSTRKLQDNELARRNPPNGLLEPPRKESKFVPRSIDFEQKAKNQKQLGGAGEELVKSHEKKFLLENKLEHLAAKVDTVEVGEGYDVLSFDLKGNKKYIEVKTTSGSSLTPFYLSRHERNFLQNNPGQYSIYRVYNYDEESNSGEFFEISGDLEAKLFFEPIQYEITLKHESLH